MKKNTTYHFAVEREERISKILEYIPMWEREICSTIDTKRQTKATLMDNGVIVIKSMTTGLYVTMFVAKRERAIAMYKEAIGGSRLPTYLFNRIERNMKICAKYNMPCYID